ncbi:hypothetical protein EMIHUDRAFT_238166 [Emiliania huxleyi CCMP1516]|uniref:Uncharacterized protein n=2 Tax=Emiliania huxleyi TaxID=2903 RepID=A0A0D3JMZ9_EMIH1|nr:hypothetical protein EMIHUDRAFT_238166 [Emiliania huxleyi CCMP1516]EOD24884.1 hypothetical protein EMIHUDRAFT_238166 [Emiliania huxleyi CCMP1516]|eukprot:XP_005777313.1 hypothetical protein EMIHUDRAFT_238166 [Emiliania huxleyi CCMP1516]
MDSVSTDLAHLLSSLRLEALAPAFAEEAITDESAHEVAQWLLKPYLVIDPGELKSKVLRLTREANRHQHAGLHANAAATYTQALALEPPNARAGAAEAVALGLKADPSSAPLKQLQAKMRADAAGL